VDYQVLENTNAMMAQFLAGELDVVCLSLGDVFTLWQKMPGLKVVLVADLSAGGDALLSFKPIQQGLNGIRVGTNLGGFGELFVGQFIADYGANPKLVELVDVDAAQAPEKLRQGSVDIVHTWEPYVTALEQQGARIVYTSRQTPGLIPDVVVVHSKVLQERPEHVKQFIAGWLEAVDWWQRDEALGNRFLEQTLGLAQVSLRGIKLMDAKDNIETFREDGSPRGLVRVTERYSRFFFDKGVLTKPPTSKEILDGRFLP
jgi:NitT/TauT family transport system substrate-binding protein